MRLTVIGQRGQVARALAQRSGQNSQITLLGRPIVDLTTDIDITDRITASRPDIIINAAAYTDVEEAERASEMAFRINDAGARMVASVASKLKIPLIHISSEYVFDGEKEGQYVEGDPTLPLNVYGHSKLAGEKAVASVTNNSVILRTSWLYSPYGSNFLTKIQMRIGSATEIKVVADRLGAPTSVFELAHGIERVARNVVQSGNGGWGRGLFHMTCAGHTSWAGFAAEIVARSTFDGVRPSITPVQSNNYLERARRPTNSLLSNDRLADIHGFRLAEWKDALSMTLGRKGDALA